MAIWTVFHITYLILIAWLTGGPTDFNGHPNHLSDHLITASIVTAAVMHTVLLNWIVKDDLLSPRIVGALVAVAFAPWVVPAVAEADVAMLLIPLAYTLVLLVPYGGYHYFGRRIKHSPLHASHTPNDR